MKIDFRKSPASGRFAILVNDVIQFETFSITRDQARKLETLIERIRADSFEEGKLCQQARGLTDAIRSSRDRAASPPLPQSANPQPSSLSGQDDRLNEKGGADGERGEGITKAR